MPKPPPVDRVQNARDLYFTAHNESGALKELIIAVYTLKREVEKDRVLASRAYRLIAENMFSIVRLELATITDQIINNAVEVKREKTGSGKAEFAMNVTATLVMLAGNVLSGGGMSLLGNLLVATGEIVQAAAKNDKLGLMKAALHLTSGSVQATSLGGAADYTTQQQSGMNVASGGGLNDFNDTDDGVMDLVDLVRERVGEGKEGGGGYEVIRRKTAFIPHGAGGTHAITIDVQESIAASYANALTGISRNLAGSTKLGGGLLDDILKHKMNATSKLHPMTAWVVKDALDTLSGAGGSHYRQLSGGSGMFGRESVLLEAKKAVKGAYAIMATSAAASQVIPPVDEIIQELKAKGVL